MDPTKIVEIMQYLETSVFPKLSPVAGIPNREPLSTSEMLEKARQTLENDPSLFLEKYGRHLRLADLAAFEDMKGDYEVNYYLERLSLVLKSNTLPSAIAGASKMVASPVSGLAPSHKQVQNRRLRYLQTQLENTEYFSDEEIRAREPRLFEFYIGQYIPESERSRPFSEDVTLVQRIFHGLDNQRALEILEQLEMRDREVEEEEEEGEDKEERDGADEKQDRGKDSEDFVQETPIEERRALREELLKLMKERFLNGKDNGFDYIKCDLNPEYDDMVQMQRDAEDAYFDSMDVEVCSNEIDSSLSVLGPDEYDY